MTVSDDDWWRCGRGLRLRSETSNTLRVKERWMITCCCTVSAGYLNPPYRCELIEASFFFFFFCCWFVSEMKPRCVAFRERWWCQINTLRCHLDPSSPSPPRSPPLSLLTSIHPTWLPISSFISFPLFAFLVKFFSFDHWTSFSPNLPVNLNIMESFLMLMLVMLIRLSQLSADWSFPISPCCSSVCSLASPGASRCCFIIIVIIIMAFVPCSSSTPVAAAAFHLNIPDWPLSGPH